MNNYYSLIYLSEHLKFKCLNAEFQFSYSPHKDVWECYLENNGESFRLIFSASGTETALFTDQYRHPKKANVTRFFESLSGKKISSIELAKGDRLLYIRFNDDRKLLFQLFGNSPNVFLVQDGVIMDAFKEPSAWEGKEEPEPRAPRNTPEPNPDWNPKQAITKTEPQFPRQLVDEVIDHYNLDDKTPEEAAGVAKNLADAMRNKAEFRVLESGDLCLVPEELLPLPTKKEFDSCNEAVRHVYYKTSAERRLSARFRSVRPRLERELKKAKRTRAQLEDADKALERAELYEQYGHILMANAHLEVDGGTDEITLENFYDDGKPVTIPLKENKTIADNAQHYYGKSADAERRVEESKKRIKSVNSQIAELETLNESFNKIERIYEFDDWFKEHEAKLNELGVLSQKQKKENDPFRKAEFEGYEIWIGRNAKSNDELTTRAHKEDIWLHARGVSGSHVVIRMNNNKEMPPKTIIFKAAQTAAWNSKARGSSLVPVIVTKRKYVVKPKGLPPGTVRVQKETVEMVKPAPINS